MDKTKQLRLGQVARKLNVGRNTIINFLIELHIKETKKDVNLGPW